MKRSGKAFKRERNLKAKKERLFEIQKLREEEYQKWKKFVKSCPNKGMVRDLDGKLISVRLAKVLITFVESNAKMK